MEALISATVMAEDQISKERERLVPQPRPGLTFTDLSLGGTEALCDYFPSPEMIFFFFFGIF